MTAPSPPSFSPTLSSSLVLCEQFSNSLSLKASINLPAEDPGSESPLVLLGAAASSLRAQVTKLSLLSITAPFTTSAITGCLVPLNESVLTSLVSAALLTTAARFTSGFSVECHASTASTFRELQGLLKLIQLRNEKPHKKDVSEQDKKAFTEATGRIWDACDKLKILTDEGVPGYAVRKSKQWLDLMKDAVKELEEWDPEEDIDDADIFGEELSEDEEDEGGRTVSTDDENSKDRAAISAGVRDQALKVLSRIPQSIHVVIKQSLEKTSVSQDVAQQNKKLETILSQVRQVSELIDESAEGMYLGNLELCLKKAGEARAVTIRVVESVIPPPIEPESKESKYIQRALQWIQQVEPGKPSIPATG